MELKFNDIVTYHIKECQKCFQLIYSMPVEIDKSIAEYLISFGKPKFNLDVLSLLQIDTKDKYTIKGKLTNNYIYFSLPRKLKGTDLSKTRKLEFEKSIAKWIAKKLQVSVV